LLLVSISVSLAEDALPIYSRDAKASRPKFWPQAFGLI